MRIVAGKLRHRNINMTNLDTTRETMDKIRGAIFNMIGPYFSGGNCLDLFTGSGAMAIEAYSRGMDKIYLNDLNKEALKVAKDNCNSLKITDAKFFNLDYKEFCKTVNIKMDLIIKGINSLKELFIKLKMPTKLSDFGFTKEDVEYMANHLTNNGSFVFPSFIPLNKDLALEVYYNCL